MDSRKTCWPKNPFFKGQVCNIHVVYADVKTSEGAFRIFSCVAIVCSLLVLRVSCDLGHLEDKLHLICHLLRYASLNANPIANDLQITWLCRDIVCHCRAETGVFARSCTADWEAAAGLHWDFYLWVGDVLADEVAVGGTHEDGRTVFMLFIEFGSFFWLS